MEEIDDEIASLEATLQLTTDMDDRMVAKYEERSRQVCSSILLAYLN